MVKVLIGAAALAALLTGCSSSPDSVVTAPMAAVGGPVDATAKKACEVAPEGLLVAIAEKGVTQVALAEGFAVESAGAEGVYLVAAKATAGGREQVAVWATEGLDAAGGTVLAVDAAAQALTSWAPATGVALGADTPAAALARACVTG